MSGVGLTRWIQRTLAIAVVLPAAVPLTLEGQHAVRWWEVAGAVGFVAGVSAFDRGVDRWIQDQRSPRSDAWARALKHGGQPEVFLTVGGGLIAAGAISGRASLERSGARVLLSVAAAGLTTVALKELAGRVRPDDSRDPYVFKPFSHHESFPSGHTTIAFAFASALGEETHNRWAATALYAGAAGTGWSRLNDHRHWLSDVVAGALVGISAAKVAEGRWRVFGLGPPHLLINPAGVSRLEWRLAF